MNVGSDTKLLYGSYDNLKDANNAILALSAKGIKSNVYVDYLDKHRKLIRKK